jgi:hypothetical protein
MVHNVRGLSGPPSSVVDDAGRVQFGNYVGQLERVDWEPALKQTSRLWRLLHRKTWQWVGISGPRCVLAVAIIDAGVVANAFAYVFDREEKRLLRDLSFLGVPRLQVRVADHVGEGASSWFRSVRTCFRLRHEGTAWSIEADAPGGFHVRANVDASAPARTLCAIAPILGGGVANCTHKTMCLPATGTVEVGGRRFDLEGHTAAFDHTSGILARDTRWRWACASGPRIGFNLVEGFNGAVENAVWLDGRILPVGEAMIDYDPTRPRNEWRVRTACGRVDLVFTPEGGRQQNLDVGVMASLYQQPIGVFRGTVQAPDGSAIPVEQVGVTEAHQARW